MAQGASASRPGGREGAIYGGIVEENVNVIKRSTWQEMVGGHEFGGV